MEYLSKDVWCDPLDLLESCKVPSPNYFTDLTKERYVFEFSTQRFKNIRLYEVVKPPYLYFHLHSDSFRQQTGPSDHWTQFSLSVNYQQFSVGIEGVEQLRDMSDILFNELGLYAPSALNASQNQTSRRKLGTTSSMKSTTIEGSDWEVTVQNGRKAYTNIKTGQKQTSYPTPAQLGDVKTLPDDVQSCTESCSSEHDVIAADTGEAAGADGSDVAADAGAGAAADAGDVAAGVGTEALVDLILCFPADALVTCRDGIKQMRDIQLYDECIDAKGEYSQIYIITHSDHVIVIDYFEIQTENNNTLHISKGHFMIANDNYVKSEDVKVGDTLITGNSTSMVRQINIVKKTGAFNPFTTSGSLMVNNVGALCTSCSFLDAYMPDNYLPSVWQKLLTVPFGLSRFKESWKCMHGKIGSREMSDNLIETTQQFFSCALDQ
jgi:hypothetical protein